MKKITLSQIYAEVNINFDNIITHEDLTNLMDTIREYFIQDGLLLSRFKDYKLALILTTKKADLQEINLYNPVSVSDDYIICKPLVSNKNNTITYTFYLPYLTIQSNKNPKVKFTSCFTKAVYRILEDLEYEKDIIEKILKV